MKMSLQTHYSGNITGQLPNQSCNPLPGPQQQNASGLPSQTQNPGIHHNALNRIPDVVKARKCMQTKIFEILMQRRRQSPDLSTKRMIEIVKRLEEGLYRSALSKEEYLNMETLEYRLHALIKRPPMNNDNHQFSHASSSLPMGIMIPTPGLSQTCNSTMMRTSVDSSVVSNNGFNTIVSSTSNNRSFFPAGNGPSGSAPCGSLNSYDGPLAGVYQQPNAFAINSGVINMVSSVGVQKVRSQMIPTPGFSNSNNDGLNDKAFNHCTMNLESSNNVSMFPTAETSIVSQPTRQKPQVGSQNSRLSHNIMAHMGSGIRSTFEQMSNGLSNGPISGGIGNMENNISLINGPGTSDHYLTGTAYDNSAQGLHEHFDQQHHPIMQGDGYEISAADALGSGNFYVPVTSVGSMTTNESLNVTSVQSMPKINSHSISNRPSIHFSQQVKNVKAESIDELENMNYRSNYPVKENSVQCLQHQQLRQPCNHFQGHQVIRLQKQENADQLFLRNNNFSPSHLSSNIVSGYKSGPKKEHLYHGLHLQVSEPSQFSDIHNQFQQNSMEDHSRATPLTQSSDQMQQLSQSQHFVANPQTDLKDISSGIRHNGALCGERYSNSQDGSRVLGGLKQDQTVSEDFGHGVCGIDEDQQNNICSKESVIGQHDSSGSAEPPTIDRALCRPEYINRGQQFKNQQRWLLFLLHARKCSAPVGKCLESNCINAQKLLAHLDNCNAMKCHFPRCDDTKRLLDHRKNCQNASCPVCLPVKNFVLAQRKAVACSDLRPGLLCTINGSSKTCNTAEIAGRSVVKTSPVIAKNSEDLEPSCKRIKTEQTSPFFVSEGVRSPSLVTDLRNELHLQDIEQFDDSHIPVKSESSEVRVESHGNIRQSIHKTVEKMKDNLDDTSARRHVVHHNLSSDPSVLGAQDVIQIEKEMDQSKPEKMLISCDTASKSGKPKINGVSLTELFTPEQVRQHIKGLRQWVGQSKAKAEKNQAMGHSMNENSCQLCAVEKLNFEPPPIYCTPCGTRIKRNAMYYTFGAGDTRHYFCIPCYNEARGDTIVVDRTSISKARVEKKKNDDETEEGWVQCDKCEAWQHQICALFNGKRNDGGQAEYTCPNCYIVEVERGERIPLPQSAVLGAKDLPKTTLSDYIEQRLFSRLEHERQERASRQGKGYDEVPGAEALVVRVVSSVDKKVEVKPRFYEIFQEQNYPTEFPYKSKVILLFQRIEGVEVCLFGMYVQEFGSECQHPNNRRVYLAYLDSVKYFRPDIRAVTGEALRTFVYQEILIGYLDYCKKRGFTSCYIWACPPMKGEDYILYCHPEIQKTPKSDKLREWYLSMLKKAERENIVVGLTNLYDHFFVCTGESKAKVTAARLPYFDGDYWPGSAEDIIYQLQQEDDGIKQDKKGFLKKTISKRALKASGQTDFSSNASKDLLLLHKLGGTISPMKEDFIMVHLQHACTHCCILMVSGNRWVCRQCKKFQLCDMCYDAEQKLGDRERHPVNHKDRHALHPVQITGVPDDTKDEDDILVSEFFDTRQAFLNLCQGNHYQYDTLRRAKHSSMMILYHLHNPTAPAFLATCCVCRLDIEAGQGWRCETCADYEICNTCHQKEGGIDHPHKLTNNPSNDRDVQNVGAAKSRVKQLRKMLDLLGHASMCRSPNCQFPNCRGMKGLFLHAKMCKKRASGGCVPCRRMWCILRIHSQACKESECYVPRCRDLRVHMRRLQQQSESRRRAAVMEMMRQRAAEVACNS